MKPERSRVIADGIAGGTRYNLYASRGGKSAETVVLIHGVGMNRTVWAPQVDALTARFQVLAYDMPGHGGSALPSAQPTLAEYAMQLAALLDALKIDRAHVIGHSMGALIALEFALTYSSRTLSVAALNAVYDRTPEQRAAVMGRASTLDEASSAAGVDATIARWFGEPVPTYLEASARDLRSLLLTVNPTGYSRTYRLFASSDAAHVGRLAALEMPALFLTGEFDPNSSPSMSEAMAAASPKGRAQIIDGARHMMNVTDPARVNERLVAFLEHSIAQRQQEVVMTDTTGEQPLDAVEFRRALGAFVTGVTVVTTVQPDGSPRGFTANSFTSVSLDPPLVLVCIAKTASSHAVFSATDHFAVSVLAEGQKSVSGVFASKAADKFAQVDWHARVTGAPVMNGAAASFDCRTHEVVDAGDHIILIGRVVDFTHTTSSPLGYCRGAYVNFSLSQEALSAAGARAKVGAILELDDGIVLLDTPNGLELPAGIRLEPSSDPNSLRGLLATLGLDAHLDFLFAVFEGGSGNAAGVHVYYRGRVSSDGLASRSTRVRVVPRGEIPWDDIHDDAVRAMLQRYVRERSEDAFGIYVGDSAAGKVQSLAPSH